MNGKKARQMRKLTEYLTPSLKNWDVRYETKKTDINVVKRVEAAQKIAGRWKSQVDINQMFGTEGEHIVVSEDCRRHYYHELKKARRAKKT